MKNDNVEFSCTQNSILQRVGWMNFADTTSHISARGFDFNGTIYFGVKRWCDRWLVVHATTKRRKNRKNSRTSFVMNLHLQQLRYRYYKMYGCSFLHSCDKLEELQFTSFIEFIWNITVHSSITKMQIWRSHNTYFSLLIFCLHCFVVVHVVSRIDGVGNWMILTYRSVTSVYIALQMNGKSQKYTLHLSFSSYIYTFCFNWILQVKSSIKTW